MEADSTTYDKSSKDDLHERSLPFNTSPGNYKLYQDFMTKTNDQRLEIQLVQKLQTFGLLPNNVKCANNKPDCDFVCRRARVNDRVQWICYGCGQRRPVRQGSFFFRLQCSLLQAMQIILAWCEDADVDIAAEHFDTKPRVVAMIYSKLDEIAAREHVRGRIGGENSVVLAEMYPDCVNRLSPDTTDQPHVHRIFMLADTNHLPTAYKLHVIKDDLKKGEHSSSDSQILKPEIERVVSSSVIANSMLVTGGTVPPIEGASPIQQLLQHCDLDMQHFLTSRIWRQALTLCAASRELCGGAGAAACCAVVQRYLDAALYRLRHADGFYEHMLRLLADKCEDTH